MTDIQARLDESTWYLLFDAHSSLRHKLSQVFEEETCYLDDRAICTKETKYWGLQNRNYDKEYREFMKEKDYLCIFQIIFEAVESG